MKRSISLLIMMSLLLGLCGCSGKEAEESPDDKSLAEAFGAAISASSNVTTPAVSSEKTTSPIAPEVTTSSETTVESTSGAPKQTLGGGEDTAGDYVTVEEIKTEYGIIQIPQINESLLDNEDVRLANDMFRSIRDRVLERVADCKKERGEESYHDASEPLCITRYMQSDNLLSVTVKYIELYPYSTIMEFNEAVSIDISTGKALDHHDVIKAAGFTEDEVKAALRCYTERFMMSEWERDTYYTFAADGTLPDGIGDPSYGWQEELDKIADGYDAPMLPLGEPWENESLETFPRYPTTYLGEDGLEVCVRVPTDAGIGDYDTMVKIGHSDAQTRLLNPNTPSGMPFGRGAMMLDVAYYVVAGGIGLDDTYTDRNGVKYSIDAESMEAIGLDEQYEPAYVFKVNTENHTSTDKEGSYAVGVFTGTLFEMDVTKGGWTPIMSGTGMLPEEIYTGADSNGALAAIWNDPTAYGLWAANPCTEVDLSSYGSGSEEDLSGYGSLILFAVEDGTIVSFETGSMNGDTFASKSQILSLTLNVGECVTVYLNRPETPTQAITVTTADDVGTYIIRHNAPGHMAEIEYITSDLSMG